MRITLNLCVLFCLLLVACSKNEPHNIKESSIALNPTDKPMIELKVDPHGTAPLGLLATIATPNICKVKVTVKGKKGPQSDISKQYETYANRHSLPVLGLYPNSKNTIEFTFTDKAGNISTAMKEAPRTEAYNGLKLAFTKNEAGAEPGFICSSNEDKKMGVAFWDTYGDLRALYKVPALFVKRKRNGNYMWFRHSTIVEMNELGHAINILALPPGYNMTYYDLFEMPDGTVLIPVNRNTSPTKTKKGRQNTVQDCLIAIDPTTGALKQEWDFRQVLNVDRDYFSALSNSKDWFHLNAVEYDKSDNTLLISSRHQGIMKVGYADKKLKWLLSPHVGFGKAGANGTIQWNPKDVLLTATNKNGQPYKERVQKGLAAPNDPVSFHWPFGQNGIEIIPSTDNKLHVLTFNNQASLTLDSEKKSLHGMLFHYGVNNKANDRGNGKPYSLMTEYVIDEQAKTVYQEASYNQSKFSPTCSGVDIGQKTGNYMMFGSGMCDNHGKFSEFNEAGQLVQEGLITNGKWRVYRATKFNSLYGNDNLN